MPGKLDDGGPSLREPSPPWAGFAKAKEEADSTLHAEKVQSVKRMQQTSWAI